MPNPIEYKIVAGISESKEGGFEGRIGIEPPIDRLFDETDITEFPETLTENVSLVKKSGHKPHTEIKFNPEDIVDEVNINEPDLDPEDLMRKKLAATKAAKKILEEVTIVLNTRGDIAIPQHGGGVLLLRQDENFFKLVKHSSNEVDEQAFKALVSRVGETFKGKR